MACKVQGGTRWVAGLDAWSAAPAVRQKKREESGFQMINSC